VIEERKANPKLRKVTAIWRTGPRHTRKGAALINDLIKDAIPIIAAIPQRKFVNILALYFIIIEIPETTRKAVFKSPLPVTRYVNDGKAPPRHLLRQ